MLDPNLPALALAPMDGITDASMRALQGETGAFTYGVTEFLRVSVSHLPAKVFRKDVPELANECRTPTGMPVQIQLLGGDPEKMAQSAKIACQVGAKGIDINYGCPAPTVNRHDGGASLLRFPQRIREIVAAVRQAVPPEIPISAKLRLGWDSIDAVYENAAMAAEGGAAWITIHARTKVQGYNPPVYWEPIGRVRESIGIPVVANGDIWSLDDFKRCRDETGCHHFMLGRGALANPQLPYLIASELGVLKGPVPTTPTWTSLFNRYLEWATLYNGSVPTYMAKLFKQWLNLAGRFGSFSDFDVVKRMADADEILRFLEAQEAHDLRVAI